MKPHIRSGWEWMKDHVYIWVILFLYQLLWGFFLYRFIDSIVMPLLMRYPDPAPSDMSRQLFFLESQFQLTRTSTYTPYLWAMVGFIACRMLITPLIHSGLLYSMANHRTESRLTFFRGMKLIWKPITLLYILETACLLAPAYWAVPYLAKVLTATASVPSILLQSLPVVLTWLIGGWLVHHLFLFFQFGAAAEMSLLQSLKRGFIRLIPIIGISLVFIGINLISGLLVTTAAMFFTGLTALILQQAYPAVQTALNMWSLSSRYETWQHTP